MGGCGGLERTDFSVSTFGVVCLLIYNSFYFGGCGGLERTDFSQFLLWDGVLVSQELIFNSFYLGGSGLERTDFCFYFWRLWWS